MKLSRKLADAAKNRRLVTTIEGARFTGYSTDHLGLLLRNGRISGKKIGRDWHLDARSLLHYVEKEPKPGRKRH